VATVVFSLLILFIAHSESIYDGSIYLLTNIVAMTFFCSAWAFSTKLPALSISTAERVIASFEDSKRLILPYAFLMTAVSLKAALMPLFSWLPKAHGYAVRRRCLGRPVRPLCQGRRVSFFSVCKAFFEPCSIPGALTGPGPHDRRDRLCPGDRPKDIKLILAYHTVSQIGLIMTGLNMDHDYARYGALYHIINHAIFKATLFLTAGLVIERYKTRQIGQIRGVWREMPAVALASLLAILGITGAPLFNGSMSKAWIMVGADQAWLGIALHVINLGTVISFVKYSSMLWGKAPGQSKRPFWGGPGHRLPALVACLWVRSASWAGF
jgi:multicomponent Na+:H+ antiporter subunit D